MYDAGDGVGQNKAKAVELYQQAHKAGIAYAGYCLGQIYDSGDGVVEDKAKAAELYQQAHAKLKDPIPNLTPIFQPNHQTLEGSFSSASKPIFAPKYAFCSIFRELQDLQSFAPIQFQNFSKIS